MKQVVLVRSDIIEHDIRLAKEIETLRTKGYDITLLCWDRENTFQNGQISTRDKHILEIPLKIRAPWGPQILLFLPIWWFFLSFHLLFLKTDVIHAINFDSIGPAIIVAKIRRKPIIYEMFDTYEDQMILPKWIRDFSMFIDKIFIRLVNVVIIVDECRIREFNGIPNKNLIIIYNSPPDLILGRSLVASSDFKTFNIFYAGLLARLRSLDEMVEAVKNTDKVKLVIAGFGELAQKIKTEADNNPEKIEFIGKIEHDEVLRYTLKADLLFSLYNPVRPNSKFASSNKMFEAMMCAKPILVSKGSSMDDLVLKENCGMAVNCHSTEEIKQAIILLRDDPEFCRKLGTNGRKAYELKYDWKLMEQRLADVYEHINN